MKKFLMFLCTLTLFLGLVGSASAIPFSDHIDDWYGADYVYLDEDLDGSNVVFDWVTGISSVAAPYNYVHNINSQVDLNAGDLVTDAILTIGFTGADIAEFCLDSSFSVWGYYLWDNSENVQYKLDGSSWVQLGEVDNGEAISGLVLDVAMLNDDGNLKVEIDVFNNGRTGDIGIDYSYLDGNFTVAPVPEPATILLMGLGLFGLVGVRRRLNK